MAVVPAYNYISKLVSNSSEYSLRFGVYIAREPIHLRVGHIYDDRVYYLAAGEIVRIGLENKTIYEQDMSRIVAFMPDKESRYIYHQHYKILAYILWVWFKKLDEAGEEAYKYGLI